MTQVFLRIQPRDPVVCRDGRPFGEFSGNRMRSLDWPSPTTTAGAVRTILGKANGPAFDNALIPDLLNVSFRGPFPVFGNQMFIPAANDAVVDSADTAHTLRPVNSPATDLPFGLQPLFPGVAISKPQVPPGWWSLTKMTDWLATDLDCSCDFFSSAPNSFSMLAEQDERTHVKIDPATFAAAESMLFSTTGLVLDELVRIQRSHPRTSSLALTAENRSGNALLDQKLNQLSDIATLGGERRLVQIESDASLGGCWSIPANLNTRLGQVQPGDYLKMALATPAIFDKGWYPGWLSGTTELSGSPPGVQSPSQLKVKLIAVANRRWEPVSGWSYEHRGPKAIRRTVPAGAVYFFEVVACDQVNWSDLWLAPTSDETSAAKDGFGLAMWGIWNYR